MYQYDGYSAVWPVLIDPNCAELRWNIVHDIRPRTQCAQLVIHCQIAPSCSCAPEPTVSQAQQGTLRSTRQIHPRFYGARNHTAAEAGRCPSSRIRCEAFVLRAPCVSAAGHARRRLAAQACAADLVAERDRDFLARRAE